MPFIVKKNKELKTYPVEIGGDVKLFVTCLSAKKEAEINRKCMVTEKGVTGFDVSKRHKMMIEESTKGWEGIVDEKGQSIPFSLSALRDLLEDEEFTGFFETAIVNFIYTLVPEGIVPSDPQG